MPEQLHDVDTNLLLTQETEQASPHFVLGCLSQSRPRDTHRSKLNDDQCNEKQEMLLGRATIQMGTLMNHVVSLEIVRQQLP